MTVGPDEGISVPVIADTTELAADLTAKIKASMAEVPPSVFDPLTKTAGVGGAKAGTALGKQAATGLAKSSPAIADEGRKAGGLYAKAFAGPIRAFGQTALLFFAGQKALSVVKDSVAEARDAQKVGALTAQVIKSTGAAAGVSAQQVGDLANALSKKVGIDDEAIQSGENLLLTFKEVKDQAGAPIFDRATADAVDLAATLHEDLQPAFLQLGKALNDPTKGLTVLGKAGVTFTAQQKDQIKALQESGDIIGAQKIILKELESQTGGAAEAQATLGDKAKVAAKNIEEAIGQRIVPVVELGEKSFLKLAAAGGATVHFFENNQAAAAALAGVLGGKLLVEVAQLTSALGGKLAFALNTQSSALGRMRIAAAEAGGGLKGFKTAAGIAAPTILATAAVAGLTYAYERNRAASAKAEAGVTKFTDNLHLNENSVASLQVGIDALVQQYGDYSGVLQRTATDGHAYVDFLLHANQEQAAALAQLADLSNQQKAVRDNTDKLSASLGISTDAILKAAAATKTDLGGAYASVLPAIKSYVRTAEQSHHPTSVATEDFKSLGNEASSTADDIKALDDAWENLVGNFVNKRQGRIDIKNDFVELRKALDKSHDSIKLNTAAGRESSTQLNKYADDIEKKVIEPTIASGGSYADAADAAEKAALKITQKLGLTGRAVDIIMRGIQDDLTRLRNASGPLAAQTSGNYSNALGSGFAGAEGKVWTFMDDVQALLSKPLVFAGIGGFVLPDTGLHGPTDVPKGGGRSPADGGGNAGGGGHLLNDSSLRLGPTINVIPSSGDPEAIAEQVANRLAADAVTRG